MAVEARPELVGKRFLCVSGDKPPEIGDIARWPWRSGVIRAVNHRDSDNPDLTSFTEHYDRESMCRNLIDVRTDSHFLSAKHLPSWRRRTQECWHFNASADKTPLQHILSRNCRGRVIGHKIGPAFMSEVLLARSLLIEPLDNTNNWNVKHQMF
ncbi:hypothetical protein JOB18_016920 [Solea senegalensis]|uniref:DUF7030 domain-containing protein n=1 Tax=Solea senegalensis TaxID=28829 RepID=A0AAV6PR55_SOLSE|nr:hypothetical protein JOB18_016920 [Solea senegalensis]